MDRTTKSKVGLGEVEEQLAQPSNNRQEQSLGAVKGEGVYPMKKGQSSGGFKMSDASFNQPDRPAKPIIKKNPYPGKPGAAR